MNEEATRDVERSGAGSLDHGGLELGASSRDYGTQAVGAGSLDHGGLEVGVDVVDLERFRRAVGRRPAIAERLFTPAERELAARSADPAKRLAVRFAAKEAVMKALGVGIGGVSFQDVEVRRAPTGAPSLALSGSAAQRAKRLGLSEWHVSMSHSDLVAVATVVAERGEARVKRQASESGEGCVR